MPLLEGVTSFMPSTSSMLFGAAGVRSLATNSCKDMLD